MPRPGNRRYDTDRAWTGKRLRDEGSPAVGRPASGQTQIHNWTNRGPRRTQGRTQGRTEGPKGERRDRNEPWAEP